MTILENLEQAFHYRGDVTLDLKNGSRVEGFLFDRDSKKKVLRLFVKNSPAPVLVPYADILAICLTGADTASGNSWAEWKAKKESLK